MQDDDSRDDQPAERGERKLSRQEVAKVALFAAIDKALLEHPPGGIWDTGNCAYTVIQVLKQEDPKHWVSIQAHLALEAITSLVQRRLTREIKSEAKTDARQGVLALPGFELVKPWVKIEGGVAPISTVTPKQHKESVKDRAKHIKNMAYPRWSEERMKREKASIAQERKLDRQVLPMTAGAPEMDMGTAMELYLQKLESPVVVKAKKAIKARWDREKART